MIEDVIRALGHLTLGSRLKRLGERLQADTHSILLAAGIEVPAAQFPLLTALHRSGPLSIGDLALSLGVSQPGITRMVRLLEASGLVCTGPRAEDQRIKTVALTSSGQAIVTRAQEKLWPMIEAAVMDACGTSSPSLLDHLANLEDALEEASLPKRARKAKGVFPK